MKISSKLFLFILILCLTHTFTGIFFSDEIAYGIDFEQFDKGFQSPGSEYRGKPFWSWNGELDEKELLFQVNVMQEMGFGGFFMHSRVGLSTEYLGDKWFELTNACADRGVDIGLEAWIYDEDRWPSGSAGGIVTANPEYRYKYLSCKPTVPTDFKWKDNIVAAFSCDLDGVSYSNSKQITKDTEISKLEGKTVLVFAVEEMGCSSFYNGYTYADTMNRDATNEYIRVTHEQYKKKCGGRIGTKIKGVFTDEPHRGALMSTFSGADNWKIPWTPKLPQEFKLRFGYDLISNLPELFLQKDGEKISQVKWHYTDLAQTLFLENWAKPIYDWCTENNMLLTGHALHEDSLTAQTAMQGSLMRFYEFEHFPGVDVLTEGNRGYWIVKQVASVSRQLERPWVLSELYGVTGWQMDFQSHKEVCDWQTLFGVNLRCPHLSWYTMEGEAKRDYPASIFYQSAWYKDYDWVETYYARLGYILNQGKPACDVLVVNPVESLWCQIYPGWSAGLGALDPDIQALETAYQQLFFWMSGSHIDFDYGDEEMMSRLCRIETNSDGAIIWVGKAPYKIVVVPKMTTMRSTTLKILDRFMQAGGEVVFVGDAPAYVDAVKSNKPLQLATKATSVSFGRESVVNACRSKVSGLPLIVDSNGESITDIFCQLRSDAKTKYLVTLNINRDKTFEDVTISIPGVGNVIELNCLTGEKFQIPAVSQNGYMIFNADFAQSQEHAYILTDESISVLAQPMMVQEDVIKLDGPFDYILSEDNVCVLDVAEFKIDNGDWNQLTEVLKIDQAVRTNYNLQHRGGEMVQPWFRQKNQPNPPMLGNVTMRFSFDVKTLPHSPVTLCMERPEFFAIKVNDKLILNQAQENWWVDNAIKRVFLNSDVLVEGRNIIELSLPFNEEKNIEAIYLIGNFGVEVKGGYATITTLHDKLNVGTVINQGLPFYSGAITYKVPVFRRPVLGEKFLLEVGGYEGACVKITSSGSKEKIIPWKPVVANVTSNLKYSKWINLEVVLTRRNTFGPLHLIPMDSPLYGPGHWLTGGDAFSMNYQLWPGGLLEAPVIKIYKENLQELVTAKN